MKLLTNVQAERLDRIALKNHSGTGHSLMKNAGRCVSNLAISLLRKVQNPEILVICGKGIHDIDPKYSFIEIGRAHV